MKYCDMSDERETTASLRERGISLDAFHYCFLPIMMLMHPFDIGGATCISDSLACFPDLSSMKEHSSQNCLLYIIIAAQLKRSVQVAATATVCS